MTGSAQITPEQSQCIDHWIQRQLTQPWPLNSAQLDLIRRSFSSPGARRDE